ncbi:hypothetical protein JCM8547_008564 [Rhodosporidiobolus lusitaniae]
MSAASQLPTTGTYSSTKRDSFVSRNGTRLEVDGDEFKVVGPNVYWLGLDENVDPNPAYPTKGRILEAMAIASVMGATTIRSQTLGISVGTGLSVENALNTFKDNSSAAWDAIDSAVYAARYYNLRLVLPLTDQYDYYHGGIPTFLRWRNLSSTDFSPFYDLSSSVYADWEAYIRNLLTHVSPYTNLTLATDPTVLAFETGNELGDWTGSSYPPPVEWTTSIAKLLKELAPSTLVLSGTYGVQKDELEIEGVDMHSDHFYPTYISRLTSSASLAYSHNKPFLAGEYDWTGSLYSRLRWAWFAMAIPVVLAAFVLVSPKRWWTRETTLRRIATCGIAGRKRRKRQKGLTGRRAEAGQETNDPTSLSNSTDASPPCESLSPSHLDETSGDDKFLLSASHGSTSTLPILSSSATTTTSFPPTPSDSAPPRGRSSFLDRPFHTRPWHFSLLILIVLLPILGALLHTYFPSSISAFLSSLSSLSSTPSSSSSASSPSSSPKAVGDLYWSLFGRDASCCAYVQHHDGYTLHYPADPAASSSAAEAGSGEGVLRLVKHAWEVRGERPYWLDPSAKEVRDLRLKDLPVVACPQEGLRLANGTVVGG